MVMISSSEIISILLKKLMKENSDEDRDEVKK